MKTPKLATVISALVISGVFVFYFVPREKVSIEEFTQSITPQVHNTQASFISAVNQPSYLPIRDWSILEPAVSSKAVVVYDVDNNKVLFQKNLKTKLPIASITKLATAIVVVDLVNPAELVTIPIAVTTTDDDSAPDFFVDDEIRAGDLLGVMLVKSSNDAAVTFEDHLAQQGIDLLTEMNKRADRLGMTSTNFKDVSGLDDSGYSTVEDLILLMKALDGYPQIEADLRRGSISFTSLDGRNQYNFSTTNQLLNVVSDVQSGKTGFTEGAQGAMILKVRPADSEVTLISVVLGSPDRFGETQSLISWAQRAHRWK
ncbi:MAG: hypothetical protein COV31_00835 [Candidatus Yanofskybacteria bacterium CG10_big_fil_rev_8_21_14_0_10_46_23]|uniref:Peptidase S11 D-alanyl-D-alanine carboxypeptidase A N-terminal domain-containing protein n=1 Tax=Candidatus Yanofskybacteria bacterium CG10_big_fil_rev_8_21_14_0_10_46_23 TaxID=1975098 RepID=A0A2H0R4E6_9BACT|nr:MAG: hypothetical protein COV31_00835 [Candidatus Yanofskybacteria bacterium CG10_big_fil_rev_8_21_14_0_10_46_23]